MQDKIMINHSSFCTWTLWRAATLDAAGTVGGDNTDGKGKRGGGTNYNDNEFINNDDANVYGKVKVLY